VINITDQELDDVCLSFSHDFGLMNKANQEILRQEAREWIRALNKLDSFSKETEEAEETVNKDGTIEGEIDMIRETAGM